MQHIYGDTVTALPQGFVPREQWPEYFLEGDVPKFLAPRLVGKDPVGMHRRLWPIVVEEYVSDKEPVLADSDPKKISANRMLIWQRLTEQTVPKGWRRLLIGGHIARLEGFAELGSDEYWKAWSESARRYRKKWLEQYLNKTYVVEKISYEEFEAAYVKSTVAKQVKRLLLDSIKRKLASPAREHIEMWGARHIETGAIAAGMATLTSPTCKGSFYISGFFTQEHADDPAMVGLMDNWFSLMQARGVRFLQFGGFWTEGAPKNWKGFSQFKAKFGLKYIACPPPLTRFARGRLF